MQQVGGGNSFTLLPNAISVGLNWIRPGYVLAAAANAAATFQVSFGATLGYSSFAVLQFRPRAGYAAAFDSGPSALTGVSTDPTTGDLTTVDANTLIIGMFKLYNSSTPTASTIAGQSADLITASPGYSFVSYAQFTSQQTGIAGIETTGATISWTGDIMAFTEVSSGTDYNLTAIGIATGAPVVGSPALNQVHALAAAGIATAAPTVGSPAVSQTHALGVAGITTGAPSIGSPSLSEQGAGDTGLVAVGIETGAPTVGNPAIGQTHALVAPGIVTGAPTVGSPYLGSGAVVPDLSAWLHLYAMQNALIPGAAPDSFDAVLMTTLEASC